MLDIVSSGDNLQEKSKLYLLKKYEKNVSLRCVPPYFYVLVTELSYEGSNSTYENYINVNKIVIFPKPSSKFGHMSTFTQIMVNLINVVGFR